MNNLDTISTDIVFVVLHYMEKDATMKCVSKIREKIDTPNYKIVIVDNASGNGSGKEIEELYKTAEDVHVIINEENLGFARGNNVGFQFAKENLNPKYIVLLNNDVYIMETYLKEKLDKEYEESQFAVLGPLIMTKDGRCNINPVPNFKDYQSVLKYYKTVKKVYWLQKKHLFGFYKFLSFCKSVLLKRKKNAFKEYTEKCYNVQLHGCFLVFSEKYIKKFDGLDGRTFLYMEEDILYKHIMDNKMKTVYYPEIVVFHEEDVATNASINMKKIQFEYKYTIDSCKVLIDVYNNKCE